MDLIVPLPFLGHNFTAVRAGTRTSRCESCYYFCFFRFVQQEARIWYHMMCDVVFRGHSAQTDFGAVVSPKVYHHPAKRSLSMCEHTGEVLGDFVVVFHRDICPEDSLIRRRNYLTTETANSLQPPRARIYRKLGSPSPILLWIRPRHDSVGFGSACCGAPMPQ